MHRLLTERKDVVDDLAVSGRSCLRAAAWRLVERSSMVKCCHLAVNRWVMPSL